MSDSSAAAYADLLKFFKVQARLEKADRAESSSRAARDRERKKYYDAPKAAKKVAEANVSRPEIAHPPEGIKIIRLSTDVTSAGLRDFYKEVDQRYKAIASQVIVVILDDGRKVEVPVTPMSQDDPDKDTYHVIAMECPGKGFVYSSIDERDNTRWCIFDEDIPDKFGQVHRTCYEIKHDDITKVEFGAGALETVFDFLNTLQQNPEMTTSNLGKKCISALYVLFGEAQRFRIMRQWAVRNVSSIVLVNPTEAMASLYKTGQIYAKAYEEAYLAEGDSYREDKNPYCKLQAAKVAIQDKEREHADAGLRVRSRWSNKIEPGCLMGGELFLLNHYVQDSERILMREAGYTGMWY